MKVLFVVIFSFVFISTNLFAQTDESPVKVGEESPSFSLPDLQNNYIFLRDYNGKELRKPWINKTKYVVVMSFFATWCAPCKKEIPHLEKLQTEFTDKNVKFFLIDVGDERKLLDQFLEKNKISLKVLHDRYQQTAEKYGANSLPRLIVIDKQGDIQLIKKGFKDADAFMKEMRTLISKLLS